MASSFSHSHWQMNYVHKLWPVAIAKCQLLVVNLFVFFPCCFYSCHLCMKEATSAELSAWTSNMVIHSHGDISIGPIANASDHRTESRKVIFDRIRALAVGTEYSFSNKIKATFHLFAFAFHIEKKKRRELSCSVLVWSTSNCSFSFGNVVNRRRRHVLRNGHFDFHANKRDC